MVSGPDDAPVSGRWPGGIGHLDQDTARSAWERATGEEAAAGGVVMAPEIGVRGAPLFVFDETYSAPGAIPLDTFRQVLRSLADSTAP